MSLSEHTVDTAPNAARVPAEEGPPSELPDPVPDFVDDLLASIDDLLADAGAEVGRVVSDIATSAGVGEGAATVLDLAAILPV